MGTGARTAIHRLDYQRLCDSTAPSLCQLAARRTDDDPLPASLLVLLSKRHIPEGSVLSAGLQLSVFGNCDSLGPDLGLRDNDAWLLSAAANDGGACMAQTCREARACPLHPLGRSRPGARAFSALIDAAFGECLASPRVLEALAPWPAFLEWRALERDPFEPNWLSWDEARLLEELEDDTLLALLLRLGKRGTLLVNGAGEGVLGWLTPRETLTLRGALSAALASPGATVRASLSRYSSYAAETELPRARLLMSDVLRTVTDAAMHHEGVALSRRE